MNFGMDVINGKSRMVPSHEGQTSKGIETGSEGNYYCCKCKQILPGAYFRKSSLRRWVNGAWQWARPGQSSRHPHIGCGKTLVVIESEKWEGSVPSIIKPSAPLPPTTITAYLDIETSGISKSEYSIVISWVLKDAQTGDEEFQCLSLEDIARDDNLEDPVVRSDERLLRNLMEALKKYNRIVTWFGKGFDVRMLRSRCLILGVPFPEWWMIAHEDLYFTAKRKCYFTSNRLGEVAKHLGCPDKRTDVTPKAWALAVRANAEALNYIEKHNRIDVRMLKFVDDKLKGQHKEVKGQL